MLFRLRFVFVYGGRRELLHLFLNNVFDRTSAIVFAITALLDGIFTRYKPHKGITLFFFGFLCQFFSQFIGFLSL